MVFQCALQKNLWYHLSWRAALILFVYLAWLKCLWWPGCHNTSEEFWDLVEEREVETWDETWKSCGSIRNFSKLKCLLDDISVSEREEERDDLQHTSLYNWIPFLSNLSQFSSSLGFNCCCDCVQKWLWRVGNKLIDSHWAIYRSGQLTTFLWKHWGTGVHTLTTFHQD